MSAWLPWAIGAFVGLIALAAVLACAMGAAYDAFFEGEAVSVDDLLAARQAEKSQLIVSAMRHDREAAFAAHAGSPFGEVPRVPRDAA